MRYAVIPVGPRLPGIALRFPCLLRKDLGRRAARPAALSIRGARTWGADVGSPAIMSGGLYFGSIQTLSRKPEQSRATELLTRAARQAEPLMVSRGWRVGTLTEFYPKNGNLLGLNVNRGQKVCVRLRPAGREGDFLPFESILGGRRATR